VADAALTTSAAECMDKLLGAVERFNGAAESFNSMLTARTENRII
jgi:hypothetical protein